MTEDLTVEEQLRRYTEAINNPLEFFKYVKILDSTINQIIPAQMWPHLVEFIKAAYRYPKLIVLKSKQVGVSWGLAGIFDHWCFRTGGNVLTLSSNQDAAADLLGKSKFIYDHLPPFLQQGLEHDGTYLLGFEKTHSRILALPSTKNAGIGNTASLVASDENEFHEYAEENYRQIEPTIDAGGHHIIVSTWDKTNINSKFKQLWHGAVAGTNNFVPMFFGYDVRPGRDEAWRAEKGRDYTTDWELEQNYPRSIEEATSPISARSVFPAKILMDMAKGCYAPKEVRKGAVNIYLRPRPGVQYMAGADIAEGGGGAGSVLWIEGKEGLSRELAAVIYSRHIDTDIFAYLSKELLDEYFQPQVIGGADALGAAYLKALIGLGYPALKIYCTDKKREKLGYQETEATQQADVYALEGVIRNGVLTVHWLPAIQEMLVYQYKERKDGRTQIGPAEGALHDIVMAMVKANFGFTQFKSQGPVLVTRFFG